MRVEKIMATMVLLSAGLLNGYGFALAADGVSTVADLDKLQEQFRVLDKELAVLKEISASKLDAQDKRISDIGFATAQHANHLSAISNQTTAVGNYIAWTSGVITLLVLAAGFITYFSATRRVKEESREWFERNASELRNEIQVLRENVQAASGEIDGHKEQVATISKDALDHVQSRRNEVDAAASKILQPKQPKEIGGTAAIDPDSAAVVARASDELKAKPETSFTAEDHYARGSSHFAEGNNLSALESFKAASRTLRKPAAREKLVDYLFAQAAALGALNRSDEAIAIYDEIDSRFGDDNSPRLREQVASGLNNKGFMLYESGEPEAAISVFDAVSRRFGNDESQGAREQVVNARNGMAYVQIVGAKQNWQDAGRKAKLLGAAIKALESALPTCLVDDRAIVLGNLGYALFLSGDTAACLAPTRECLKLGGEDSLDIQRGDARLHRVEPEDSNYEALLGQLWAELHPPK
jgi:tetratricopeptide (TPR) repeat protein